jgi:hypothetical protein
MKYLVFIIFCFVFTSQAQEMDLPELSPLELSPKIQSPLYQNFTVDEFDLLVKNVNVFASPKRQTEFSFLEASSAKEGRSSYQQFYTAINRQMAQYSDFKVEIDNSKAIFMDYHDEPIYSGLNRVRNSAYIEANRLTNFNNSAPLLYSPSLSARRGLIWY